MTQAFENLLVSSPNGGGLLYIHHGHVFRLDDIDTTGISQRGGKFLRGLQPEGLVYYQGNRATQDPGAPIHDIHDVLIADPFLYAVGTCANEVLQFDMNAVEVRRWRFPGEDDALHINCLTQWNQQIVFCAFGDFTAHRQYKGNTAQTGFVQDLHTGKRLIEGLSQPHSVVALGENLLLANSETRELREYDINGRLLRSKVLDGYTRGICVQGNTLYIGLSRSRNIDSSALMNANLVALDVQSWQEVGRMELPVSEIYTVIAVDESAVLPPLLAGISQQAATDYRRSINSRDEQIQALSEKAERFKMMSGSLEAHLDTRNKQFIEHVEALVERDAYIIELSQERISLMQKLEDCDTRHAEDQLKHAQDASTVQQLEDALQEQSGLSAALQEQFNDASRKLLEACAQIQEQEEKIQALIAEDKDREKQLAELEGKDGLTRLQLDQITEKLTTRQQQLSQLSDVIQEKTHQLNAVQDVLADRDSHLKVVGQQLKDSEQTVRQLRNSNSWRLTRPVRDIRRWLKL